MNRQKGIQMKKNWLPSICTLANLSAGALSVLYTIQHQYKAALLMVVVAAIFDVLDGFVARLLRCTSDFGKQLDSLADLISFGVAPTFLVLLSRLDDNQGVGAAAVVLFLICGALRLARFNVSTTAVKGFIGMPITAAGIILSASTLLGEQLGPITLVVIMGILSILMVSRVPFPKWQKSTAGSDN
jgi:CDP-diacylglycerol--serine O-phosphatidyltransferase